MIKYHVATFISGVAIIITMVTLITLLSSKTNYLEDSMINKMSDISIISNNNEYIERNSQKKYQENLKSDTTSINEDPGVKKFAFELQRTQDDIKDMFHRQKQLEEVILEDPLKALETTMLRHDIENMKKMQKANIEAIKREVDKIYDMNKWLIGGIATSVLALAISNFLKGSGPSEEEPEG